MCWNNVNWLVGSWGLLFPNTSCFICRCWKNVILNFMKKKKQIIINIIFLQSSFSSQTNFYSSHSISNCSNILELDGKERYEHALNDQQELLGVCVSCWWFRFVRREIQRRHYHLKDEQKRSLRLVGKFCVHWMFELLCKPWHHLPKRECLKFCVVFFVLII